MNDINRLIRSVRQGRFTEQADSNVATSDLKEVLSSIDELINVILLSISEGYCILDQVAHGKVSTGAWRLKAA